MVTCLHFQSSCASGSGSLPMCDGPGEVWDFVGFQIDDSGKKHRPDWWVELIASDVVYHEEALIRYFGSMGMASKELWQDLPLQLVMMEHPMPHPILAADILFNIRSVFWPDEPGWGKAGCISIRTSVVEKIKDNCQCTSGRCHDRDRDYLFDVASVSVPKGNPKILKGFSMPIVVSELSSSQEDLCSSTSAECLR